MFGNDNTRVGTGFCRAKKLKDLLVISLLLGTDTSNATNNEPMICHRCHRKVFDACNNFVMSANVLKVLPTIKVTKLNSHYLAIQIMSVIALIRRKRGLVVQSRILLITDDSTKRGLLQNFLP